MPDVDIAIVGAGVAGLTAALECAHAGVSCTLLEAEDAPGGRIRTDLVDGFMLDRGFQVFLTAYPEAVRLIDYDALDLRPFIPGADVYASGAFRRVGDPRRRPLDGLRALFGPITQIRDIPALLRLAAKWTPERLDLERVPDITAEEALRRAGLSPRVIDAFFRPFFGGVFFDPDLHTSARMLAFCFSMFASGAAAVPARGMQRIPEHLAAQLPSGVLNLGCPVGAIERGAVKLESGETVTCKAVLLATPANVSAMLTGHDALERGWRSTSTVWFSADTPPTEDPILMLNGEGHGPVNHLAILSNAAPPYSPDTRALIAANVVDQRAPTGDELVRSVRQHLTKWFGSSVDAWTHLHTHVIPRALPDQLVRENSSVLKDLTRPVEIERAALYVCGDHTDNASINGAMASGRRAASSAIEAIRA
ncbi:MAG: NAD(P)/FAD-dependent oxidoreductase [Phycisphaerales bacterium]